jgi:hypothetical protein
MDTQGRTMLQLTAMNIADEMRDRDLIVSLEADGLSNAYSC